MQKKFHEIKPESIGDNPFTLIGSDWMLITAGSPASYNTMTANWGGLGFLWDKNVSYCFIRPRRHTFGFIERSDYYTFSFFDEKFRHVLDYCGEHSGRNVNKAEKTGITPVAGPHDTVYFAEARLVIVSRKLYVHDLDRQNFLDHTIVGEVYPPGGDVHRMYIGEVVACLSG